MFKFRSNGETLSNSCSSKHQNSHQTNSVSLQSGQRIIRKSRNLIGLPRLIFLDLDNTLIPTSWMMQEWHKTGGNRIKTTTVATTLINRRLEEAGLFKALDTFFGTIVNNAKGPQRIVIVTNAAIKTVESFYLTYCLPQLQQLLNKYDIPIRSTERWTQQCGPVPKQTEEEAFREYYTSIKLLQFNEELNSFIDILKPQKNHHSWIPCGSNFTEHHRYRSRLDIVSVGDQLCEIHAAIRLGVTNASIIRHTKLLMILDLMSDRFLSTTPEDFVKRLKETLTTLTYITHTKSVTVISKSSNEFSSLMSSSQNYDTDSERDGIHCQLTAINHKKKKRRDLNNSTSTIATRSLSRRVAVWVTKASSSLVYCIAKPKHFPDTGLECGPYLDLSTPESTPSPERIGTSSPIMSDDEHYLHESKTEESDSRTIVATISALSTTETASFEGDGDFLEEEKEKFAANSASSKNVLCSNIVELPVERADNMLFCTNKSTTDAQKGLGEHLTLRNEEEKKSNQSSPSLYSDLINCHPCETSSSIVVIT